MSPKVLFDDITSHKGTLIKNYAEYLRHHDLTQHMHQMSWNNIPIPINELLSWFVDFLARLEM